MRGVALITLWFILSASAAAAEDRLALLIGNQNYRESVGPLKNPHNDIALVGAALEKLGFKITSLKDAGYKAIEAAVKSHAATVRRAGKQAISFVYYAGHGASDPDTKINYVIPVDVDSADDASIWTNSLELNDLVNKLRSQAPEAVHYVVFDACRDELHLTREGKKAIGSEKGFVAVGNISGVMVAYATAPGRTASDGGRDGGVYAKSLSEEIVKPGIEAVTMFRNVQLKVKQAIGQDPWLSFPPLPAVYFAGAQPSLTREQQLELDFWLAVKDSAAPAVLRTYLERYPHGEFAAIAGTLAEHYDRKLKAEQAAQEEEQRRTEEERKAAEVKRLEEEQRVREARIAEERRRADQAKSAEEVRRVEEQQRAELVARTEELRKALEEARLAREAANKAEEERVAAVTAAEAATKAANDAINLKRSENAGAPAKVAALPNAELSLAPGAFDGFWSASTASTTCRVKAGHWQIRVHGRSVDIIRNAGNGHATLDGTGSFRAIIPAKSDGTPMIVVGKFHGSSASGTYTRRDGRCGGRFVARRG